jgi:long-chain acyl-CoA synthetase
LEVESYLADLAKRQSAVWPAAVPRTPEYPLGEISIAEHLRWWAEREPSRTALIYYGREVTFGELDELSDRYAGWLQRAGVVTGDRVAVMLPNCPQFVVAMMAALKLGAVHVPVNPMFQRFELQHELADSDARVLLCQTELKPLVDAVAADLDRCIVATTSLMDMAPEESTLPLPAAVRASTGASDWPEVAAGPRASWDAPDIDALAALNYTGGTTGLPKGCEHTQRHMLYTTVTTWASAGVDRRAGHVALVFVPIFWIGGENSVISMVVRGHPLVLLSRWDPEAFLLAIERYGVTECGGTVDNYVELMDRDDFGRYDLSSLVNPRAMSFVRKLTPDIRHRWMRLVGQHSVLREAAYGMTETHTMDTSPTGFAEDDHDLTTTPVFCGLPMPGTQFMVVDEETREPLPLGERGAILIRTPSLMTGYWRAEEATRRAMVGGWFDTGDKGMVDDDGCLHYLGRDKDMIKVNGMSVFPSEVEAILAQHPDVEASAVVAAADDRRGQVPVAFVRLVPDSTATADDLMAWAGEHMAIYKVPLFRFVDSFPMTDTGKIRKVELSRALSEPG